MATTDNKGRVRVGPEDRRTLFDRVWPQRHGKWWNFNSDTGTTKKLHEILAELPAATEKQANAQLEHVEAIARSAAERAAAADRRASTIAGSVAIAASFTLSGAGFVLDTQKVADPDVQVAFAMVLFATTVSFVFSAVYALRALVGTHQWNWTKPPELDKYAHDVHEDEEGIQRQRLRAAYLLKDFAANWEISDLKNRCVDMALRWLVVGLIGIAAFAALLVYYTMR